MKKYTLKAKLSKKKQKEIHAEKRISWDFSPVSRVIPNKKKEAWRNVRSDERDE